MSRKKIQRILLTAIGGADPYKANSGELYYGSMMSILSKLQHEGTPITDVYLYFSLEEGIREFKCKIDDENAEGIITRSIKSFAEIGNDTAIQSENESSEQGENESKKINITYYPKGIEEDILNAMIMHENDVKENINDNKKIMSIIQGDVKIACKEPHKFGEFYPVYYSMFEDIAEINKNTIVEVYANVSSGTPAMEADMNLIALTNNQKRKEGSKRKTIVAKIMQVATPERSSNSRIPNTIVITGDEEQIKEVYKQEEARKTEQGTDRAVEEKMEKTRALILKQSIEASFFKFDYAGVYYSISANKDYISNKKILYYARNLYYRYIGNDEKAQRDSNNEAYNEFIEENKNDIYPIFDDNYDYSPDYLKMRMLIERVNIMAIKAEREEINDWLLIAQTVIESLYKKLIYYVCDFDFDKITNANEKISKTKFSDYNQNENNKYDCFKTEIENSNDSFANAYLLNNILNIWWDKHPDDKYINLRRQIYMLDDIRTYRNRAAHNNAGNIDGFITKAELGNDKINNITQNIKDIVQIILQNNNPDYSTKLDDSLKVYATIKNKILGLLQDEINGKSQ